MKFGTPGERKIWSYVSEVQQLWRRITKTIRTSGMKDNQGYIVTDPQLNEDNKEHTILKSR